MIEMMHRETGQRKFVKAGFSWTTFFFGFFVPIFRGDFLWALIMLGTSIITSGFGWIIFPFFYNKVYINRLLKKGYVYASSVQNTNAGTNVSMNANPTFNANPTINVNITNPVPTQGQPVAAATTEVPTASAVEPTIANSTLIDKPRNNQITAETPPIIAQVNPTSALEEHQVQEEIKRVN